MTRHHFKVLEGHIRNYIAPCPEQLTSAKQRSRCRDLEEGVGKITLAQMTPRCVSDFRDSLRDVGLSVATTRKILSTLQLVLQHAIGRDLIAINAAKGIKVIGRRDQGPRRVVPPEKHVMKKLIDVADDDFRLCLTFAAATGLRAGELHALRWRHVNLTTCEVTVETRVDAYGQEGATKTHAGLRTLPLGRSVVSELKAWRLRSQFAQSDDLVFPNKRGWYVSHDNMVKRRFKPLFDKTNVEPFNWHALRHFAISCWIEAELSPKTVQTFAGHSSLQVTMDRYGHLFKSDDHQRAMDTIADRLLR